MPALFTAYLLVGLSASEASFHVEIDCELTLKTADVNGGEKIMLRLRPSRAPDTFYMEDQLVDVMLHEVCLFHVSFLETMTNYSQSPVLIART